MRTAHHLRGLAPLVVLGVALGAVSAAEVAAPRAIIARGPGIPYAVVLDDVPELLRLVNGLDEVAMVEVAALLDEPQGFDERRLWSAGWEEQVEARMSTRPVRLVLCWFAGPAGGPDCERADVQRGALYLATPERPAWVLMRGVPDASSSSVRLPSAEALTILECHGVPTRLADQAAPSPPAAAAVVVALLLALVATPAAVTRDRTYV
jgi:hypothetical protein